MGTRQQEPRQHMSVRVGRNGREWIRRLARKPGPTEAAVMRASLVVARRHEPEVIALLEDET